MLKRSIVMSKWNFPSVTGGGINSINNAGLETFRDNPIDSLTREICQNSLDAVKNPSEPVVVEFKKFIATGLPGQEQLLEAFYKGKETWKDSNEKSLRFINSAIEILNEKNLECLRISDFNTVGLSGAKEARLGSPWSSLIKEAGSSNKKDDSGGSFGIGKAAPFLSSNIRTLFYSSFDEENFHSHIGVADIMSFKKEDNSVTLGKGYYTDNVNSNAIVGLQNLDPYFKRKESGTDIYIAAFNEMEDWKNEMVKSILKNFFITVFQEKLVVKVDGFVVNHHNIGNLIERLEDTNDNQILKNYYNLLTSERTIRISYPAQKYKGDIRFEEGEAELLLMEGEDLNRRVLMTRKTGMRIFEQSNISGNISFTGLLLMKGKNMNKVFKQMENPAHNAWLPSRYEENPKVGDKIFADLRKFIRDTVKDTFYREVADTINAIGLGDFLPNKKVLAGLGGESIESVKPKIKSIDLKEKGRKSSGFEEFRHQESEKTPEEVIDELDFPEGNSEDDKKPNESEESEQTSSTGTNDKEYDSKKGKENQDSLADKNKIISSKQRYICIDKENGEYKFSLIPQKEILSGYIKFKLIGEQSNFDLPINNASFKNPDISLEKISGNVIHFTNPNGRSNFDMNIKIGYSEYCVLEAGVYENS